MTVVDWCRKRGGRERRWVGWGFPAFKRPAGDGIPPAVFLHWIVWKPVATQGQKNVKLQWNKVSLNIKTKISPRKDVARLESRLPTFRSQPKRDKGEDLRLLILYGET